MNKKLLIILSVIISVLFVAAHFFFGYSFQFDNICFYAETKAGSILANDDDETITLFKMNDTRANLADGTLSYKKMFKASEGELCYNHPLDIAENGGKIYLLNQKKYFSERSPEFEIYQLDFARHKMNIVFSFSAEEIAGKLKRFLENDEASNPNSNLGSDYFICGDTFLVDNEGITLYYAERPAENMGTSAVYECKLIGGEIGGAKRISEYRPDMRGSMLITDKNVFQLDRGYRLMIGGENRLTLTDQRYSSIIGYEDGAVIAKSADSPNILRIEIENGEPTDYPYINELIENETLTFSDISNIYTAGGKTVAVCNDGEKSFLFDVVSGKKQAFVYTESIVGLIIHSLIAAAAAAALVWLVGFLIHTLKARGRVSVKFVSLVIPVMIGCDLVAYGVIGFGMKFTENHIFQSSLKAVSTQYTSFALTDDIGDFGSGEYRTEIDRFINILVDSEYLKNLYWTENSGISADVNFLGYVRAENTFVSTSDLIEGNYDVDVLSTIPSKIAEKISSAAVNRANTFCRIYDNDLERMFLISPVEFSGDGSVNGVFLYSVSTAEVSYNIRSLEQRLMIYMLILGFVIALLFTLSAVFPLRGLKKLQKKSTDYLSGGYTVRYREKAKQPSCYNEIDVISEKFDALLDSVNSDFNEIDNLRRANVAYFSDVILKIFNKKTINSIKFGESASVEAYCIKALLPEQYSDFDTMNRLLTALGKSLKDHNAFAADIDNTGLSIYSLEPQSVNVLFFLREYDSDIVAAADKCYIDISTVNIGGSYHFNITREDGRREEILMNTLLNTKSAAVVTESVLDMLDSDFSMICIGMADNRFIYEVSDGVQRRFANSIRDYLKNGIEWYFNGDHTAAREMFVMILKRQQDNSVARYYINLLDDAERADRKEAGIT